MTNAEKYKDAIMAQMRKTGDWTIEKASGEIVSCDNINCVDCKFYSPLVETRNRCIDNIRDWLNAEEKKEFSEKDKAVIRVLDKTQWLARDKNGRLYAYAQKPHKGEECWDGVSFSDAALINGITTAEFASIKWEDKVPTSRAEILGDEQ